MAQLYDNLLLLFLSTYFVLGSIKYCNFTFTLHLRYTELISTIITGNRLDLSQDVPVHILTYSQSFDLFHTSV